MTTRLCSDSRIHELCSFPTDERGPMIEPYVPLLVRSRSYDGLHFSVEPDQAAQRVISYGLSSAGYDVRCSNEFRVFTSAWAGTAGAHVVVDPKAFDSRAFVEQTGDVCVIPPHGFVLAHTVETFDIPPNVLGVVLGKSTYARVGIHCLATPLEPGWKGQLVLEFSNLTPVPAMLYANEGCAQILFFEMCEAPSISYADRGGKYQGQRGTQLPLV